MDVFLKVCEISIVVLQITNRQDFLISYDTYMSTPKWICKLQVTSRVKGTWRRKWRHCYRYISYDRTIMELDPTGKEVFWFFFITTFTTKMIKISKIWFWWYVPHYVRYTFIWLYQGRQMYFVAASNIN